MPFVSLRRFVALALIAGLPGIARAQFTTFIPPQNKVADSIKAVVVAEQKAQTDSTVHAQLTNMKTWVDSAAGLVPEPQPFATDTLAVATRTTVADTSIFRNGARAPATASPLPLLVLVGLLMLLAGGYLVREEPTRATVRTSRKRTGRSDSRA